MNLRAFRDTLALYATGVTVVLSRYGLATHGMTVNSFTSVSLRPPLVLFCADNRADTLKTVQQAGYYTVSILGEEHAWISQRFAVAGPQEDLLAEVRLGQGPASGVPYLSDALAFLECRVTDVIPAGDHHIVVGEVEHLGRLNPHRPLIYFDHRYRRLTPEP
ncbi:MAG: flavin reductase family protein [Firmicutes bacterium]|nr:flavin reductase family protein [Bacillota bacterium]